MRLLFTFLVSFLGFNALQAQVSKDATVPLTATIAVGPTSITLNWPNPGNANLLILRRTKGQAGNAWVQLVNQMGSNLTTLNDNGVAAGQIYEYVIQRTLNGINAFGYAHVAINANPVNSRGKILIFVDSTTADALGVELVRMKNDMRGDGWWPIPFKTGPFSTVQSVKNQIIASYNADPLNVKAVLLIGNVPIPYSGNTNWDGHPEHAGAWPSDAYYADVNGTWTDASVNNTTPARAANVNVPGDGKFDQSFIPTLAELQVGRIDFRRLNAAAFGAADHIALVKRYLDKNHKWRIGEYVVDNKALVDDNFGYFGGEAFAANGFRNAYPLVGEANVVEADFFNDTNPQSYLLGYGCGGGTYQSAGGVGSSANFATDSVNIVFSNLFGSYHGDWDFETDPFMPSALASRGGILTCSWAGRPHWFNQAFASGETIGYCGLETMNAQFNNGFFGTFGESGAHVALLGDPTLRAHVVKPAKDLVLASPACNSVSLNWTASADVVTGYHIYRALSQDGPYTRLTSNPVNATSYTDNSPILDTLYYQVRAIKNVSSPGGGTYANNGVGPISSIVFTAAGGPVVTTTGGTLNCNAFNVMLTANATPASVTSWSWSGPNNFSSSLQNPTVMNAGTYTVTATDAMGCLGTATAIVESDYAAPAISAMVSNTLNCVNNSATITVSSVGLSSCTISGPGGFFVQGFSATVTQAGTYTITATSSTNGCIGNSMVNVLLDVAIPGVSASNSGPINCANSSSQLIATSNVPGVSFAWSGPCVNGTTATCAGTYTVTVTNTANGCTNTATTAVLQDLVEPSVSIQPPATLTCAVTSVPLIAIVSPPNSTQQWTGPCLSMGFPPMATCPGTYTVVVTNTANGCINSASVVIVEDTQVPNISFPPLPTLTCINPCAVLTVPNIPGIQLCLAGQPLPPGFTITLCDPGIFVLQAKSLSNGCSTDVDVILNQDIIPPIASAGPDKFLSCFAPSIQLDGSGSSSGASYLWVGPGGFTSTLKNPFVSLVGIYTLTVTSLSNGCTASDQVQVISDGSLPTADATVNGQLNCTNQTVQLMGISNALGAFYAWTGPNGFTSNLQNPTASAPGIYNFVVTTPGGCSNSDMVEVIKAPDFVVTGSPVTLDCDGVITSCVNVSGGTPPYNILWSNGSTTSCATYSGSSTVGVTVTDQGGCSFQNMVTVEVPPSLSITIEPFTVNCSSTGLVICATPMGGTPPYSIEWSNGDTDNCATFNTFGTISVSVTDVSGCVATASLVVVQPPTIALSYTVTNESAPNANNGTIDLSVSGGTGPIFVYLWSNGAATQDLSGLAGGTYTVTVTDATTGCTQTASVTVNTTVGTEEAALFAQFQLSPNPTEGLASLTLKLHKAAALRVEIRDVAGRLVWENPVLETDVLALPIDLTQSPAGVYTVSVWVEHQVFVRKLAVVR